MEWEWEWASLAGEGTDGREKRGGEEEGDSKVYVTANTRCRNFGQVFITW